MGIPIRWKYQKLAMLSRQRKRSQDDFDANDPEYSEVIEITAESGLVLETEASNASVREYIRIE